MGEAAPTISPHRVLIVDDEEIVLVALRETLARAGFQTCTSKSPLEALDLVQKEPFAAILSDHQMPRMSGLDFLTRAKSFQPDASRILITAVLSLDTVIDAINKGEIYRFLVKPWLREELLATVKNAMSRYELMIQNSVLHTTALQMNEKLSGLNHSVQEQLQRVSGQNHQLKKLNDALVRNLDQSVQLCVQILRNICPILENQAKRVFEIIKAISITIELNDADRKVLEISALLHDVGFVAVPPHLIRKWLDHKGDLTSEEWTQVRKHPVLSQELVEFADNLAPVGEIIRAHHERFDGGGFPDGLKGEQTSWLARLLAVAVAFAETPADTEDAVLNIRLQSGSAFDPEAVRAFMRAIPKAVLPPREREVLFTELRPGMVLAKGIYSPNGLLLIPEGQELSHSFIDKLLNHNQINLINHSFIIYC